MITIKNKFLKAKIDTFGAEIKSLKFGNQEYAWQGDPDVWGRSGPVLFPVVGNLKNGIKYKEENYELMKHGFAKNMEFSVENRTKSSATLLLCSNDETRKLYPFDFELRAVFTAVGKSIVVSYEVKNTGNGDMYFSIGSHEGYACPGGPEEYDIVLPGKYTLKNCRFTDDLLNGETETVVTNSTVLPLYNSAFENGNLLFFCDLDFDSVILRRRVGGRKIKVTFPGCENLAIWTKPGAEFVCVEPWAGLPDTIDFDGDITRKPGIKVLKTGKKYKVAHKITILEEKNI